MSKRLFVAVKYNADQRFEGVYDFIKHNLRDEDIKWTDYQNLHFTLKFYGRTPGKLIKDINKILGKIAVSTPSFELNIDKLGLFGSQYKPRVIWTGMSEFEQMEAIANKIAEQSEALGFIIDRQNFIPHLTLGRIKGIKHKKYFQDVIKKARERVDFTFSISEFQLLESILTSDGPIYKVISTHKLQK
ncbi:MAG: RNA 2',3'-cyclic phosphodiesterase [Hyphomicrobiales bacterium]